MARWLLFAFTVGCLPPGYGHAERTKAAPAPAPAATSAPAEPRAKLPPSAVRVALFDPSGQGNWGGTVALSPAPASLIAPCLEPGAVGWISIALETHTDAASTTHVVESSILSEAVRTCIANALTSVRAPPEMSAWQALIYASFALE